MTGPKTPLQQHHCETVRSPIWSSELDSVLRASVTILCLSFKYSYTIMFGASFLNFPILCYSREMRDHLCNKYQLDAYLSSVLSRIFVAHHQEVYCIYTTIGTCCVFQLTVCWPGQQTVNWNTQHVPIVYIQYTSWWWATNMPETCRGCLTK